MRTVMVILLTAAGLLIVSCAGTRPPHPELAAELAGQDGAQQFNAGNFNRALRLYGKALAEARRIDNAALRARYQFNIGRILYESARFDSAQVRFGESTRLFTMVGTTDDAAVAGIYEALAFASAGMVDTAVSLFTRHAAEAGTDNEGIVVTARTILSLQQGDKESARRSAERAMELARERNNPFLCGGIFYYQAMIAFSYHDRAMTRQLLDSSLHYLSLSPYRYRNWKTLLGRAVVDYCSDDSAGAERFYRRARMAAPDMVVFPGKDMVKRCPDTWR